MELVRANIKNFRCVEDSEEFSVNRVTCFVGKNEAGKSALLEALWRINPHNQVGYDRDRDYPRRFLTDYEERHGSQPAPVTETHWRLNSSDKDAIRAVIGPAADSIDEVKIVTYYPAKPSPTIPDWIVQVDEIAVSKWLIEQSTLTTDEKAVLAGCASVKELRAALATQATERHQEFKKRLEANPISKGDTVTKGIVDILLPRLPKFVYFSSYDLMKGKVQLESLQQRKNNNPQTLERHEQLFLDFCEFAGTTVDELIQINQFERLRAKFEAAQSKITRQIFEYWSSNTYLRVLFSRDAALPGDPAPFHSGQIFNIRVWNDLHESTVPFDDRSAGFVWFFSFLVFFSQVRKRLGKNLILLLDEPGLNLHAKAQGDLLRFMKEKLAPEHQVLYSTHSLFMIPSDNLLSARIVEDVIRDRPGARPEVLGTKVRTDVLSVKKETLFPLQGALGFEISQTLFIGKHTLIVEGPSDLLYLKAFSRQLAEARRISLDRRWTICPVGGIEKVPAFLALFNANDLQMAVLVDLATGGKRRVEDTRKLVGELRNSGRVFTYADIVQSAEADVEDMLGVPGYLELVNATYGLSPGLVPPGAPPPRVVKWTEGEMRTHAAAPEFDHYAPAEFLLENRTTFLPKMTGVASSLDRFERLFSALNTLL